MLKILICMVLVINHLHSVHFWSEKFSRRINCCFALKISKKEMNFFNFTKILYTTTGNGGYEEVKEYSNILSITISLRP